MPRGSDESALPSRKSRRGGLLSALFGKRLPRGQSVPDETLISEEREGEDDLRMRVTPRARRGSATRRRSAPKHNAQPSREIDYVPTTLHVLYTLLSFGIYPYVWTANRIDGFEKLCPDSFGRQIFTRYCVVGTGTQVVLLASVILALYGTLSGDRDAGAVALSFFTAFFFLAVFVVMPYRSFCQFEMRWRIRAAAAAWDQRRRMTARTAPSLAGVFLLGTAYLQYHINRLMGLGMPGFDGYDDISGDFSLRDIIISYVRQPVSYD